MLIVNVFLEFSIAQSCETLEAKPESLNWTLISVYIGIMSKTCIHASYQEVDPNSRLKFDFSKK